MNDISKHLGDERRLKLSIDKIKEYISKSTPVVNWYAHTEDKTVRGPFGRWFTASGEDKHLADIRNDVEYCAIAMTILPDIIYQLEQQLEEQQMKIVKDFKRGEPIPNDAKFISSREFIKTEQYDDGHPQDWGTRIIEQYWIDTYEVFLLDNVSGK